MAVLALLPLQFRIVGFANARRGHYLHGRTTCGCCLGAVDVRLQTSLVRGERDAAETMPRWQTGTSAHQYVNRRAAELRRTHQSVLLNGSSVTYKIRVVVETFRSSRLLI
jgi:hypothetical protein